jgi:predicted RND superfamily exporter protein
MDNNETLSYKIAGIMERRSGWFILSIIVITALLTIPVLTMAPDENASENPGGQVFDLQDDIDERFPPAFHSAGIIVEARGEDVLTQKALWELYQNTERLRQADQAGELAPPGLEAQSFLFSFYFAELERPVVGIYSLADEVQEVMASDPLSPTLENASDDDVKLALHRILSDPMKKSFREDLSIKASSEPRQVDGQEIVYWRSPALFTFVVADNEKLGGGSLRIGTGGDDVTKQKEQFNRKVQKLLRGDEENYRLWGIAIDIGLEIEDEAKLAGPFIMFTAIGVLIVVGLALRSYWAVALTGAGLGILMIWLKGISNLIGLKSGLVIDLIVPIAMISLGVDFAIHALHRYGEEKERGSPPRLALRLGFAGVLGALALAMLSDGIAFGSNVTSGIETVTGFGIGAAVAVLAAFIVLGLVAPLVMMRIDGLRRGAIEGQEPARRGPRQRRRMAVVWRVLGILVAAGFTGAGIILLVAISPVIGIAVIAAFSIFGVLLPMVVIALQERRKEVPSVAEVVVPPVAGGADQPPETAGTEEPGAPGALASTVVRLAQKRLILLPLAAVITAAAIFYALKLEPTLDVKDFFDSSSDFVVSLDKIDVHVAERGGEPGLIYIKGNLSDPESLGAMRRLLDRLELNPKLAKDANGELNLVDTVFTFLERLTSNDYALEQAASETGVEIMDADGDGVPDTEAQIKAAYDYMVQRGIPLNDRILAYTPARIGSTLFHDITGVDQDVTVVQVQVPGTRETTVVTAARESLEKDLQVLNEAPSISKFGLTGSPFTREASLNATTQALKTALPIAAALCFLVILVVMRSVRFALVTIIPIGLVVAWLYAFMYLAGFALNWVTATIAAISIGIGIDYSIHMTQRFREELTRAADNVQALRQAAQGTGVALMASAATSIVGFTVMAFAPMPLFASYGILTAVMIFLAAAASLVVLPSLLLLVTPDRRTRA